MKEFSMSLLRFALFSLALTACSDSGSDAETDAGADTSSSDTGSGADTGSSDTGSADTGSGSADTGSADTGSADTGADTSEPTLRPTGRLTADGTRIVDAEGNTVLLRGVNLGGWLFHETWLTALDLSDYQRAYLAAHDPAAPSPIAAEVDASITAAGAGTGTDWQAAFGAELTGRTDAATAADFVAGLPGYPSVSDDSDLPLRQLLEQRFGTQGRDELMDLFQSQWVKDEDIAWLADHGFNLVRIPIGYRSLVTNSDLEDPTTLVWNEAAFARLEALLDSCAARGLYAVVDIQESPGGHNDYSGPARLYESEVFAALTVSLWEELSRRLHDRDEVAAYSLLAEPFSAPSNAARDAMYDRLYDAIRALGDDHLLVIHDGFSGMNSLPVASQMGWSNVVYSTHNFEWSINSTAGYRALLSLSMPGFRIAQADQGVPWFIGSFSTMRDRPWAYDSARLLTDGWEAEGWSWATWTYKKIDDPIDVALLDGSTSWGVRGRLASDLPRPDIYEDTFEELRASFEALASVTINENPALLNALTGPR